MTSGTGPVLTWNLFVTLLAIPIFIFVVKYLITKGFQSFNEGWERYREEKEKNLTEWRSRMTTGLDDVKNAISDVHKKLPTLITQDQCDEMHADIFETVNDHGQKISVLETKVSYLEKGGSK